MPAVWFFNEQGEETFNFGKHKGKRVVDVFAAEPSYFSWMMQGDFPLYTKRKLEEIHNRMNASRAAARQNKPAEPVQRTDFAPKERETTKPDHTRNNNSSNYKPLVNTYNKPFKKKEEPAEPLNEDMLKQLADKFKKG